VVVVGVGVQADGVGEGPGAGCLVAADVLHGVAVPDDDPRYAAEA
jgi:hypothetical protein